MKDRIYVIEHGAYFESGFYDDYYYLSVESAKKHLKKMGYKYIKKEHMYSNESIRRWALINYLDLSND